LDSLFINSSNYRTLSDSEINRFINQEQHFKITFNKFEHSIKVIGKLNFDTGFTAIVYLIEAQDSNCQDKEISLFIYDGHGTITVETKLALVDACNFGRYYLTSELNSKGEIAQVEKQFTRSSTFEPWSLISSTRPRKLVIRGRNIDVISR
jgi:hypothetical protein